MVCLKPAKYNNECMKIVIVMDGFDEISDKNTQLEEAHTRKFWV